MSLLKKVKTLLDKVCYLYKSLDNGEKITKYDFTNLLDQIVELCHSNSSKDLLCLLLSYYTQNDVIRKNKFMNSEPQLKNIIKKLLNDKNLDISYEDLNVALQTFYYKKYEEDYEYSLYKKVKDKVILLNRSRLDKTKYTFYDIQDMINQILEELMDDYGDEDNELDKTFIEIYDRLIEILQTEDCNLTDDKNNTLIICLLSKYYNGYCREIKNKDKVYSIKNMINVIIKNEKFNPNIKNCYGLTILSMAHIIKKHQINYEEHDDYYDLILDIDMSSSTAAEDTDEVIKEIEMIYRI